MEPKRPGARFCLLPSNAVWMIDSICGYHCGAEAPNEQRPDRVGVLVATPYAAAASVKINSPPVNSRLRQ